MSTAQDTGRVYALLADGTTVEIREAGPEDFDAVQAMHEAMAPDNIYLRFFSYSRRSAETEARRICRDPTPDARQRGAARAAATANWSAWPATPGSPGIPGRPRSRSRWPTTCTTRASPPCCSSTWSRWPGAGRSPRSRPRR